jgi:hypothetical protein
MNKYKLRSFILVIFFLIVKLNLFAQSFTEMAFNASKATVDTSETFEKIEACHNTFDRLLLGEPNDSLLNFYWIFSKTKMAYLSLNKTPKKSLMLTESTAAKINFIDTAFKFGYELQMVKFLQNIITKKVKEDREADDLTLEKEIEQFYLLNKNNARANLIYAYYHYCFNKVKKQKLAISLVNNSLLLFSNETLGQQKINWGQNFAKDIKKRLLAK